MGTTPTRSRAFVAASFQYLGIGTAPVTAAPMTLACFTKPTALAAIIPIALSHPAPSLGWFQILQNANGTAYANQYDGTNFGLALSSGVVTAGRWNHLCAVFTSNSSRAMFINGANKGTDTTAVTTSSLTQFCIGIEPNTGGYYNGNIAGVAVWNVALTDAEVAMLASGISPLRIRPWSIVFYAPNGETPVIGTALTNNGPTASQADPTDITWTINGTDRSTLVRKYESSIDQTADGTPDTCTFMARGFTPTVGHLVSVVYHNDVLFAGEITDVELVQARASARAHYRCQCIDAAFLLNRRLVLKQWTNTAAETIVGDILSGFTTGFTTTNVQTGLTAIDFLAVQDSVSSALQRVADTIGARWKVRPDKDLYFRVTSNLTAPTTINTDNLLFRGLSHHDGGDQIRNRVFVTGAGVFCPVALPVGAGFIPVSSSSLFSTTGGNVMIGPQRPAYTGIAAGGVVGAPVGTWGLTPSFGGAGSLPDSTSFSYKIAYLTPDGESLPSAASSNATTGVHAANNDIQVVFTPTSGSVPGNIIGFRMFASDSTSAGAGPWHLFDFNTAGNLSMFAQLAAGGFAKNHAVVNNAAAAPLTTSTAGNEGFMGSTTTGSPAVGATSVGVNECGHFKSTGGIATITVNGNSFPITYTGRTVNYGAGSLTGIPASGFGSVLFAITAGTAIQSTPTLTGVTGIVYPVQAGEQVRISVQRDDTGSQTVMAGLEGGDGIHEFRVDDSTLDNVDACSDRGDAELTLGADAQESASFVTQDQYAVPGASVVFSIGALSSTIPIASARVYWEAGRRNPQRQVSMTTQVHTLYQVLGDLQRQAKR